MSSETSSEIPYNDTRTAILDRRAEIRQDSVALTWRRVFLACYVFAATASQVSSAMLLAYLTTGA